MIYQVLAKVFLICSGAPLVVPAQAGTHKLPQLEELRLVLSMSKNERVLRLHPRQRPARHVYIGITSNLGARLELHRKGRGSKFVQQYKVHRLVHVETFARALEAIAREKQLKNWQRRWKIRLIEENNVH